MFGRMLYTLAVANYRSLRELILPLGSLNVVTGPNGSGKSNLYRGLRLLSETAFGTATSSLAAEGGFESVLWAGPESFSRQMRSGDAPVQGSGSRRKPINLRFGFCSSDFSYAIDYGMPEPVPGGSMFDHDPIIKREAIWHGDTWHDARTMVDRRGPVIRARDDSGRWQVIEKHLPTFDSMLTRTPDPERAPEVIHLREQIRSWRFYDHFRTDFGSPVRQAQIGTRTPVLSNDGHDLPAAWQTIREIGDVEALDAAVADAFPGAEVSVRREGGRFELAFRQHGLLRELSLAELSDGTLRYLLWIAALLTPRLPTLMVLNEPETSLHPDLLPPLGRLMKRCADRTQLWVISHAQSLVDSLTAYDDCVHLELDKQLAETVVSDDIESPAWRWPTR